MTNRIFTVILALLIIISGGLGYYTYRLNMQLDTLQNELDDFQLSWTTGFARLSESINTLGETNAARFAELAADIETGNSRIDDLDKSLEENAAAIDSLKEQDAETTDSLTAINDNLEELSSQISRSGRYASEVYQKVSGATVRINDGSITSATGTGFLYHSDEYVLTAYHVIEGMSSIYAIFPDGRVIKASSAGVSMQSDIAVLKLKEPAGIDAPPLADSGEINIGEPVAVIGNPLGLNETLTAGIVSQLNRYQEIDYSYGTRWIANLIQIDAPANPGNSGCPVFNAEGEVIGMVIARVSPLEGDGIYYAISANKLKRVADEIITSSSYDYPRLGINSGDITPQLALERGLDTVNGALVASVSAGGPADSSGVKADDIILTIDGTAVRDTADLVSYLGENVSPGDTVTLGVLRDSSNLEITVKAGIQP